MKHTEKHTPLVPAVSVLAAIALLVALLLSSCSGDTVPAGTVPAGTDNAVTTEATVTMTGPELAAHLATACTFTETLTQNDVYLANHAFGFGALADKLESYTAYVPAGIVPEEVFVFCLKNEADVAEVVDKLNAYVAYQATEYAGYAAAEVPKLDDPVILAKDKTVVYVVSKDNAAAHDTVKEVLG